MQNWVINWYTGYWVSLLRLPRLLGTGTVFFSFVSYFRCLYCVLENFAFESICYGLFLRRTSDMHCFFPLQFSCIRRSIVQYYSRHTIPLRVHRCTTDASVMCWSRFFLCVCTSILDVFISAHFWLEIWNDAVCVVLLKCPKNVRSLQWNLTKTPISHAFFNMVVWNKTGILCISHTRAAGNGF